jgi:D-alanyl-D-alanine dipeptidase
LVNGHCRITSWIALYSLLWLFTAALPARAADLVEVVSVAPGVQVEMRYARGDNFTGRVVYDCGRCFLRRGTAEKVATAQRLLAGQGLSLKMWDCYRPLSVQRLFWSLVPDPRYVADPGTGSRHNRGTAVDVTLVDADGRELSMPTKFDDFSPRASHAATDLPPEAVGNRQLLADTMTTAGFRPLADEWWHYDDPDGGGELLDVPFNELCRGTNNR